MGTRHDYMTQGRSRARVIRAVVTAAITAVAIMMAAPAAPAASQFRDVPASHQFSTEIAWLSEQGITTGFSDGNFRPRAPISREAFAAFLYRLAGRPSSGFLNMQWWYDVPQSHQFMSEIAWVSANGITRGFPDRSYRPKANISREAVAAFLYRFEGKPSFTPPRRSPFTDLDPQAKFYKEITWLASTGLTTGFADGSFRPKASVTREAVAAFLYRGFAIMPSDGYYNVGTGKGEVRPGIYVTQGRNGGICAWEHRDVPARDHSRAGTVSSNSSDGGRTIVEITSRDRSFRTQGCEIWGVLRATNPKGRTFREGDYLADYDMEIGYYTAPGGDRCTWVEYMDFQDAPWSEVAIGHGHSPRVAVQGGIWSRGCGTWTYEKKIGAIPRSH